jgi:methylmalonyl-CoA/ethylmalonyl-CoA epimerase
MMKLGRINHIGVATPDLDASIAFYRDVLGATDVTEPFLLESQKVRVCFVNTPGEDGTAGTQVELLQPTEPDSAVGKWLEKNPLG